MYLEESEKRSSSEEEELSTEAMIAEQCQVPKVTEAEDLTSSSKGSAELGMKVLVEYPDETDNSPENDSSVSCVDRDENANFTFCSGHSESFEQYPESEGSFESDQTHDKCDTSGLSQPFDECAQHCECFKPFKSSEHCANHSLAPECSPCCEHCTEHLQLCQQCQSSDQQFESFDSEPDPLALNADGFEQSEMSDFIPECAEDFELQQYECADQLSEDFDTEPDTSAQDCEQCQSTGPITNVSDSEESLDCGADLYENDGIEEQTECSEDNKDDYEESYPVDEADEQNEAQPIEEEESGIYFYDNEDSTFGDEGTKENSQQEIPRDPTDMFETNYPETSQDYDPTSQDYDPSEQCAASEPCHSGKTSGFCSEEDGSSYSSSFETKSFKTCPRFSIPSDCYSESSGESEKGAQEDSGDEQLQWESFEDDEYIETNNVIESKEKELKTPHVDIVIEDYFDLFDRADYHGQGFTQKRHYISCFDGGDIHDCLFLEAVQAEAKKLAKDAYKLDEIDEDVQAREAESCSNSPERTCEGNEDEESPRDDPPGESCGLEKEPEDLTVESESSLVEESKAEVNSPQVEDDEEASDGHVSESSCEEDSEEESMSAPCAEDIYVEGDAYEDEVSSHFSRAVTESKDELEPKDKEFIECSEMEPYWSLAENEGNEEVFLPGVEEYYIYHMKSIELSVKQAQNVFVISEKVKSDPELVSLEFCSVAERTSDEEESDEDPEFKEISKDLKAPLDIIHSVSKNEETDAHMQKRTEDSETSEHSTDSEEEQSEDEQSELCECEYCIPPNEQVS